VFFVFCVRLGGDCGADRPVREPRRRGRGASRRVGGIRRRAHGPAERPNACASTSAETTSTCRWPVRPRSRTWPHKLISKVEATPMCSNSPRVRAAFLFRTTRVVARALAFLVRQRASVRQVVEAILLVGPPRGVKSGPDRFSICHRSHVTTFAKYTYRDVFGR
jgi:hypothetical protein